MSKSFRTLISAGELAPHVAEVLRGRRREKLHRLGYSIGFPLLLLALWQAAASAGKSSCFPRA